MDVSFIRKAYHMESACCEVCSNAHLQCHSQYSVSAGTVWTGAYGNPSNACTEESYYVADRFNCIFGIAKALEQIGLFRTFRKQELVKNA